MNGETGMWLYLATGALVFVMLGYFTEGDEPPPGWWRQPAYWLVTGFVVVFWPAIAALYLIDRATRRRLG